MWTGNVPGQLLKRTLKYRLAVHHCNLVWRTWTKSKCFRAHVFTKELIYLLLLQFNYMKCSYYYILITIILYMLHLIAWEKKIIESHIQDRYVEE